MGKKMKLPSVFKSTETSSSSPSSWFFGACNQPNTLSFRATNNSDIFKTMNTVYINTPDSSSYLSMSSKTIMEEHGKVGRGGGDEDEEESIEEVIKGLSSERLFFEVVGETSSILEEANNKKDDDDDDGVGLFKESVAMEIESRDPFVDFKRSMEEMMESNHMSSKDNNWDFLEELLACYLKVNHKSNHGYIVGAFVDLLVSLQLANTTNSVINQSACSEDQGCCSSSSVAGGDQSFTSPLSFYSSASSTSPCLSSLMESEDEIEKSEENAFKLSPLILTNV